MAENPELHQVQCELCDQFAVAGTETEVGNSVALHMATNHPEVMTADRESAALFNAVLLSIAQTVSVALRAVSASLVLRGE